MASPIVAPPNTWTAARRKRDGKRFYYIPGSKPGAIYMTAIDGCTCPAAQHSRDGFCKHQGAVRRVMQPMTRPSYADLFPVCPCGDVADTQDGLCDRCASEREFSQRMESKREAVR